MYMYYGSSGDIDGIVFFFVIILIMAVANLHIRNKYICQSFLVVFILITDLENIGMDTIFVKVSCILSTILNKIDFSILESLICIF